MLLTSSQPRWICLSARYRSTRTAIKSRWDWTKATIALLSRIPSATVVDLDAGCCGMAGSFGGYSKDHYEVSKAVASPRPVARGRIHATRRRPAATGTSRRHQIAVQVGDLMAAGGAGCHQDVAGLHGFDRGQQAAASDGFRNLVVIFGVAERSGHAAAACIEIDYGCGRGCATGERW